MPAGSSVARVVPLRVVERRVVAAGAGPDNRDRAMAEEIADGVSAARLAVTRREAK
jgi:hypothetical protein